MCDISLKFLWEGECFINDVKSNSLRVAILIKNNFEHEVIQCNKDKDGNFLQILLKLSAMTLTINGPNNDNPSFWSKYSQLLIICPDFNLVINPEIDTQNYKHISNPKARASMMNLSNYG